MPAVPLPKILTYEEYLATPCIRRRFEIIDGILEYNVPFPSFEHQDSLGEFFAAMRQAARGKGKVIVAPFDILIRREPLRTRQPDICYFSQDRLQAGKPAKTAVPDLVVEILSPSNTRKAVVEKFGDYATAGVNECWMLDLRTRVLTVWRLDRGVFRPGKAFRWGHVVQSAVFPPFKLPASAFGA